MTEQKTRAELLEKLSLFEEVHSAWVDIDISKRGPDNELNGLAVEFNGRIVKSVSEEVEEAIADIADFVMDNNFELRAYRLVMAVDGFIDEVFAWYQALNRQDTQAAPDGSIAMWNAMDHFANAMREKAYRLPEPLSQLVTSKPPISYAQMARMYGFFDAAGNPDTLKLSEEIDEPGRHYDPKTWVHPDKAEDQRRLETLWIERSSKFEDRKQVNLKAEEPGTIDPSSWGDPDAPESIEELLRTVPTISTDQIARMLKIDEEVVKETAIELGIGQGRPWVAAEIARRARGAKVDVRAIERKMLDDPEAVQDDIDSDLNTQAAMIENYSDFEHVGERIILMLADGHGPGIILRSIRPDTPNLSLSQVMKAKAEFDSMVGNPVEGSPAREYGSMLKAEEINELITGKAETPESIHGGKPPSQIADELAQEEQEAGEAAKRKAEKLEAAAKAKRKAAAKKAAATRKANKAKKEAEEKRKAEEAKAEAEAARELALIRLKEIEEEEAKQAEEKRLREIEAKKDAAKQMSKTRLGRLVNEANGNGAMENVENDDSGEETEDPGATDEWEQSNENGSILPPVSDVEQDDIDIDAIRQEIEEEQAQ